MYVLVVGAEKNFAALSSRLFKGRVSAGDSRRVADALRLANPHADLDDLRPGTVLTVPDLRELKLRTNLSVDDGTRAKLLAMHAAAAASLDAVVAAAEVVEKEQAAERRQAARALQSRPVEDAAKRDTELAADVEAARRGIAEEDDRAKARAAALKGAHAEWTAEIGALKSLVPDD